VWPHVKRRAKWQPRQAADQGIPGAARNFGGATYAGVQSASTYALLIEIYF